MVSTEAGRDSIRKNVFGEHKVAEETVKAMAALRLIDSEVLAVRPFFNSAPFGLQLLDIYTNNKTV